MAIKGVIFDNQYPTAKQFGAFLATAISDGRCYGGDISYNGLNVTIGMGVIMACGRAIELTTNEVIKLTQTSGYAQIILTLDMSATATETAFSQAAFSVRYSSADNFSALTKDNINSTGTRYQMEIATVLINASAVTQIVRKYASCASAAITDGLREDLLHAAELQVIGAHKQTIIEDAANYVMSNKAPTIQANAVSTVMTTKLPDIRNSCYTNLKLVSGKYGSSLPATEGHVEGDIFVVV